MFAIIGNLWWVYHPTDCAETSECGNVIMQPIVIMGIAYGILAGTSVNSIVYLVPKQVIGTALGMIAFAVNFGLIVTPLVFGQL